MRAKTRTLKRARVLRKAMSLPEVLLWKRLRGRAPDRVVFRRQHPIEPYVLDFYCPAAKLCVEIDGASHEGREKQDAARDVWLANRGIEVIRLSARSVLASPEHVAGEIMGLVRRRLADHAAIAVR